MRNILAVVLLLPTAGCVPIPKTYVTDSRVAGVLANPEGNPVPGVVIKYSQSHEDAGCSSSLFTSTTDAKGEFDFPGKKGFLYWVAMAPVTYMHTFRLCVIDGESNLGWNARVFGGPAAPALVEPICKVSSAQLQCELTVTP